MEKDWDIPATDGSEYGNQGVAETNVITIAQLKQKYASALLTNENYKQIDESMQIKGVVTGNDIEGNIYNQIGVEDGTGSVIICIAQGGLYGQLQVGREILVELKDLYFGSYGKQPQIGTPYKTFLIIYVCHVHINNSSETRCSTSRVQVLLSSIRRKSPTAIISQRTADV